MVVEEILIEAVVETKPAREKKVQVKADQQGIKVVLPMDVSQRLNDVYTTLKERGFAGKVDDLLVGFWEQVNQEWCDARIEALTPDEYYLDATKQLPEVRQKLVDQAKKALLKAREVTN